MDKSRSQPLLTDAQKGRHEEFKSFVRLAVEPFAEQWDREQRLPDSILAMMAKLDWGRCLSIKPDGWAISIG